jgi:hypothetical protein
MSKVGTTRRHRSKTLRKWDSTSVPMALQGSRMTRRRRLMPPERLSIKHKICAKSSMKKKQSTKEVKSAKEVVVTTKGVVVTTREVETAKGAEVIAKEGVASAEEEVVSTQSKRKRKNNTKSETTRTGGRKEMTSMALKRSLIRRNSSMANNRIRRNIIIRNSTRTKRSTSLRAIDPMTAAKVVRGVIEAAEVAEPNSKPSNHSVSLRSTNRWRKKLSKSLLIDSQQWTAMTDLSYIQRC